MVTAAAEKPAPVWKVVTVSNIRSVNLSYLGKGNEMVSTVKTVKERVCG